MWQKTYLNNVSQLAASFNIIHTQLNAEFILVFVLKTCTFMLLFTFLLLL